MTPTTHFPYRHGQLCCEMLPLTKLADAVGTPAYVYSKAALLASYAAYDHAFKDVPHLICYSIKANSNLGVISTLAKVGAGADIVSGGELHRALRAGVAPKKIIFSGVGKTRDEMRDALKAEILLFNVESVGELRALDEVAREVGTRAPVALRVNPDVDPLTHKYIATGLKHAKFGIPYTQALAAFEEAARLPGLQVVGADMHIGSQLTKTSPLGDAVARVAALVKQLRERRIEITTVDVGGGLGIRYPEETADVVGPICESGDFFAKDRALPRPEEGDLLAILSAGAYGFAMASNYNTRPRPVEVLVDGDRYTIVRRRETFEDLVAGETTV